MDKKKPVVLGLIGLGSALGLGWLISRVIKDEGEGGDEIPAVTVNMYWD